MDIAMMMDENAATEVTRATEQRELQTAHREDAASFETGKGGALLRVAGKKPKLTAPTLKKTVETFTDMQIALYNLAYHYQIVGECEKRDLIHQHVASMRGIWHRDVLRGSHSHMIGLDRALRQHRCRTGATRSWVLDTAPGSAESTILDRAAQDAQWSGKSRRRDEDRSQADTPGGAGEDGPKAPCRQWEKTGTCTRSKCGKRHDPAIGKAKRKEREAKAAANKAGNGGAPPTPLPKGKGKWPTSHQPECDAEGICAAFAWYGNCGRATGDTCAHNGRTLKHTCLTCRFKNSKHKISEGVCLDP
jgi:hypothetical protein